MTQAHANSKQYMQTILPIDKFHTRFLAHYDLSPTDIFGAKTYGPNVEESTVLHYDTERIVTRDTDTYVLDKSKGSHFGKLNGVLLTSGMNGTAFQFAGGQYISAINGLGPTRIFTIEFWFKEEGAALWTDILTFDTGVDDTACRIEKASDTGNYVWYGKGGPNSGSILFQHDGSTWDHIILTSDGTTVTCYKNGIQSFSGALYSKLQPTKYINIGRRLTASYWSGCIDMIAMHTRAFTAAEAMQRYRRGIYTITDNGKFDRCISITKPRGLSYANPISGCRQFTIAFWAKITALNTNLSNTLLSINNYAAAYTQTPEICIDTLTADSNKIRMLTYNDSLATTILTGPVCQLNTWTHFAFVRETNKNIMYINGAKVTEGAASTYSMTGGVMQIGARDGVDPRYIEGMLMDELRIDDVARTADEIYQWYNSGTPFYPKGMERMV